MIIRSSRRSKKRGKEEKKRKLNKDYEEFFNFLFSEEFRIERIRIKTS